MLHLTAEALAREQATEIAVQLTAGLKDSAYPTAWFLPVLQEQVTIQILTRTIIIQLLGRYCDSQIITKISVDTATLHEDGNEDMWFELLEAVLNAVRSCFIVIELSNQSSKLPDWSRSCQQMVAALLSAVVQADANGRVLKVLVITHGSVLDYPQLMDATQKYWLSVLRATPVNIARTRQLAVHQRRPLIQQLATPLLNME